MEGRAAGEAGEVSAFLVLWKGELVGLEVVYGEFWTAGLIGVVASVGGLGGWRGKGLWRGW